MTEGGDKDENHNHSNHDDHDHGDKKRDHVKRSNTLERLADLLKAKQKKKAMIKEKRRRLKEENEARERQHQQFLDIADRRSTTASENTADEYPSSPSSLYSASKNSSDATLNPDDTPSDGEDAPLQKQNSVKSDSGHARVSIDEEPEPEPQKAKAISFEEPEKPTARQDTKRGVRFNEVMPTLARGVSRQAGQLKRTLSRSTSGVKRSVSRLGNDTAKLSRSLSRALIEDRKKLLGNALRREQAALERAEKRKSKKPKMMNELAKDGSMKLLASTAHGVNDFGKKAHMQQTRQEKLMEQVEKRLKGRKPWFARIITLVQLVILVTMMLRGRLAPWGMGFSDSAIVVDLFVGTSVQEIRLPQNPYYGPDSLTLVAWGSKWAPCMREHEQVIDAEAEIATREASFGCCVSPTNECGQMASQDCTSFGGTFTAVGQTCAATPQCTSLRVRPCCFGIIGQCAELTEQHCNVVGGIWNVDKEKCGESDCLGQQCGLTDFFSRPTHPNQFYRFITAMFLHVGVIHFVMNAVSQYVLVSQVEFVAGPFRTAAMYIMSGAFGFLISALFSAESLSNGSSAAIYGMIGAETVDLFQTWQLLDNKKAQVLGLTIKLVVFLGIGTLPYIDNFAHIGGFLAGIVAAICLLPYITFSSMDACRKLTLKLMSVIALFVLAGGLLYKFYTEREIVCGWCQYANCVPYTSTMCEANGA